VNPAAILFDFGGTLDACAVPWKERFAAAFAWERVAPAPAVFDRAFYDADDALVGRLSRRVGFAETVERLARGVAANLGVTDETMPARAALRFVGDARTALEESARVLEKLAPRYRLGVVSNFYGNLHAVLKDAGLAPYLSVAVDSEIAGATKPDPAIFRSALRALRLAPENVLLVGDSPRRDMAGAKAVGMPHVLLGGVGAEVCCPGDRVIPRLPLLLELLP